MKSVLVTILLCVAFSSCESEDKATTEPPLPPQIEVETAQIPQPTAEDSEARYARNYISVNGGRMGFPGGMIEVESGALEDGIFLVTLLHLQDIHYDATLEAVAFGGWWTFQPSGTLFDPPARIMLGYAAFQPALGDWESGLVIYHDSDGEIEALETELDTKNALAYAPIGGFSGFTMGVPIDRFDCGDLETLYRRCENVAWACAAALEINSRLSCQSEAVCGETITDGPVICQPETQQDCLNDLGYSGSLTCLPDCSGWGPCESYERCGDHRVNGPEICEPNAQQACQTQQGYSGYQPCLAECSGWGECVSDEQCGDGVVNGPEICESHSRHACKTQLSYAGNQPCLEDCSGWGECVGQEQCGDLLLNGLEICDGETGVACVHEATGYAGIKSCDNTCHGWTSCNPLEHCGDGIVNGFEECDDGANAGAQIGCSPSCRHCNGEMTEYAVKADARTAFYRLLKVRGIDGSKIGANLFPELVDVLGEEVDSFSTQVVPLSGGGALWAIQLAYPNSSGFLIGNRIAGHYAPIGLWPYHMAFPGVWFQRVIVAKVNASGEGIWILPSASRWDRILLDFGVDHQGNLLVLMKEMTPDPIFMPLIDQLRFSVSNTEIGEVASNYTGLPIGQGSITPKYFIQKINPDGPPSSGCAYCGNGVVEADEICDDGEENGYPGKCAGTCEEIMFDRCREALDRYDEVVRRLDDELSRFLYPVNPGPQCDPICHQFGQNLEWEYSGESGGGSAYWSDLTCSGVQPPSPGHFVAPFNLTEPAVRFNRLVGWDGAVDILPIDDGDPTACSFELRLDLTFEPLCENPDVLSTLIGPTCGNGRLDPNEQCDDGNRIDEDACRNSCALAQCGDGVVHAGAEICDDGGICSASGWECFRGGYSEISGYRWQCEDPLNEICVTQNGDGCNETCTGP